MFRSQQQIRRTIAFVFAAGAVTTLAASAPSLARGNFDGTWSVSIVTEKGECDRGYRYPIAINNGVLANAGDSPFDISGKVATNGAITVRVAHGDKAATGQGRCPAPMARATGRAAPAPAPGRPSAAADRRSSPNSAAPGLAPGVCFSDPSAARPSKRLYMQSGRRRS